MVDLLVSNCPVTLVILFVQILCLCSYPKPSTWTRKTIRVVGTLSIHLFLKASYNSMQFGNAFEISFVLWWYILMEIWWVELIFRRFLKHSIWTVQSWEKQIQSFSRMRWSITLLMMHGCIHKHCVSYVSVVLEICLGLQIPVDAHVGILAVVRRKSHVCKNLHSSTSDNHKISPFTFKYLFAWLLI